MGDPKVTFNKRGGNLPCLGTLMDHAKKKLHHNTENVWGQRASLSQPSHAIVKPTRIAIDKNGQRRCSDAGHNPVNHRLGKV